MSKFDKVLIYGALGLLILVILTIANSNFQRQNQNRGGPVPVGPSNFSNMSPNYVALPKNDV